MERIKPFRSECGDQYPSTSMLWQPKWRESQSQSSFSIRCWRNIWTPILQEKTQGSSSRRFSRTEGNNEAKVDVIVPIRCQCQCQCQCINASMGEKKKESGFSSFLFFLSSSSSSASFFGSPCCCSRATSYLQSWFGFATGKQKKKRNQQTKTKKKKKKRCFGFSESDVRIFRVWGKSKKGKKSVWIRRRLWFQSQQVSIFISLCSSRKTASGHMIHPKGIWSCSRAIRKSRFRK